LSAGLASFNQIAGDLKGRNLYSMARQSLHQCFDIRSTAFLVIVLCDFMQQCYSTVAMVFECHTDASEASENRVIRK
jgi:hypothetical protein